MSHSHDILIVDDEDVIIRSVMKICSLEGWTVDSASDGVQALEKVRTHDYRLILSDIMMPGYSGLELLRALIDQRVNTPVIMTTGYTTVENAAESIMLGAIDFLPKPFTMDELLTIIKRGLRHAEIYGARGGCTLPDAGGPTPIACPAGYHRLGCTTWMLPGDDGSVRIGATGHYLSTLDSVEEVVLFERDAMLLQGNVCAQLRSVDGMTHNLLCAMSGSILDRNEALLTNPHLLRTAPFTLGWIYRILPTEYQTNLQYLVPCAQRDAQP